MATLLLLLCALPLRAQEVEPLVTDRPSFSAGTYTLTPGTLQIESGYQLDRSGNVSSHTFPLADLRYGLRPGTEVNLIWSGLQAMEGEQALSDLTLAVKQRLEAREHYNLSLHALLTLPTGTRWATQDRLIPSLAVLWDYRLHPALTAFGTGVLTLAETSEAALALGLSFPLSQHVGAFVEYHGHQPLEAGTLSHQADAGITFLLSPDVQVDVNGGLDLRATEHFYVGCGLGYRLRR